MANTINAYQRKAIPASKSNKKDACWISRPCNDGNGNRDKCREQLLQKTASPFDKLNNLERIRNCKVILHPITLPFKSIKKNEKNQSPKEKLLQQRSKKKGESTTGETSNVQNSMPLMRKCRVLLKRIDFSRGNTKENVRTDATNISGREKLEKHNPVALRKCAVRIKRMDTSLFKENNPYVSSERDSFESVTNTWESSDTLSENANKEYVIDTINMEPSKTQQNPKIVKYSDDQAIITVQNTFVGQTVTIRSEENVSKTNANDFQKSANTDLVKEHHNRFFHREVKTIVGPNTVVRNKNTSPKKRTPQKNIFDFLSESQNQVVNPVDDIIQRLIDEGKVIVATNCKGRGRPKIKRKVIGKKKAGKAIKSNQIKTAIKNKIDDLRPNTELPQSTLVDGATIHGDIVIGNIPSPSLPLHHRRTPINSPDGTFSRLARSVLIQQTSQQNLNQQKQKLLDAARKFVSTPIKHQSVAPPSDVNISPIAVANSIRQTEAASRSPWRVDQDAQLPVAFNFSTNSSNLPSFSSDAILPLEEESQTRTINFAGRRELVESENAVSQGYSPSPSLNLSSFNDSNAENMPPPPTYENHQASLHNRASSNKNDANANIFNLRQCPNPRRGVQKRSPLKAINILEVVTLPPIDISELQSRQKNDTFLENDIPALISSTNNSANQLCEIQKSPNCNFQSHTIMEENVVGNKITTLPAESTYQANLFGFEEFIVDETESQNNNTNIEEQQETILNANHSLREKLKELKKWRPNGDELLPPASTRLQPLFDDIEKQTKQRNLKEMLCSTMINSVTGRVPVRRFEKQHCSDMKDQQTFDENNSHLFKDVEPDVTFTDKEPRRTYGRPFKKKRKIRHNFVMFIDSDESNSEGEDVSHEEIKLKENGGHKRKVQHKEPSNKDAQLDMFISEFNEMCKDVDQYKLVIE